MFYEALMKSQAQLKLRRWQDWWMAGGRNEFLELPPTAPPPPPKGEPGVATVGGSGSPLASDLPSTCLFSRTAVKQPQPPPYPPPPKMASTSFNVPPPQIAEGRAFKMKQEQGSSASSAKAPAVPMQPPSASLAEAVAAAVAKVPQSPRPTVLPDIMVPPIAGPLTPGTPPTAPLKPNPNMELATGWKPKMAALLAALELNLTARVKYLVGKFLD